MKVKVFIPTYKRLNSLKWVLLSLVNTKPNSSGLESICYIVNNYIHNKEKIEAIIKNLNTEIDCKWKFKVIHRKETLAPVKSWYGAINEFSDLDDIVFLHGDDDIFLPNSIDERVNIILNHNADLLLTKHISGIKFFNHEKVLIPKNFKVNLTNLNDKIKTIGLGDDKWSSIFIGNNTYRYTKKLQDAITKSFEWSEEQSWLPYDMRTLMLPFYIPIALMINGGKVVSQNKFYVIRGINYDELINAKWGVPGWNSGFIHLVAKGVLNNIDLGKISQLDRDRQICDEFFAEWYYTIFLDDRISKEIRSRAFKKIGKPNMNLLNHIVALKLIIKEYIYRKTKIIKLKQFFINREVEAELFINSLKNIYG